MSTRRLFMARAIALTNSLFFWRGHDARGSSSAPNSLRFLILGGTGHIGPYFVRAAAERGHHVSVFSRGLTNAGLPGGVEHLVGDRNRNLKSAQGRDWDAVLDLATYGPGWVRSLGEALKGRVGYYTFVSTVSVYKDPAANGVTSEISPVLTYDGKADPYSVTIEGPEYGALKVLCEQEAETQFPGHTLIVRPASIAGPSDTHPYIYYWLLRAQRGGEILAVGDSATPVQFIDVRDLAAWTIRMVENRATGIYNATGPARPTDLAGLIDAARATAPVPPRVTWVSTSWLETRKDAALFNGLLFWRVNKGALTGISNAKALAHGLTTRSVGSTMVDEWRWLQQQPPERTVFAGFRRKPDGDGFEPVTVPWPVYLAREKELLAAWHTHEHRPA